MKGLAAYLLVVCLILLGGVFLVNWIWPPQAPLLVDSTPAQLHGCPTYRLPPIRVQSSDARRIA